MRLLLKHPARHYVYYLLTRRLHTVTELLEEMGVLGLPVPGDESGLEQLGSEVLRVRATLMLPVPFNPRDKTPTPETLTVLRALRIHDIWRQPAAVLKATEILGEPRIRHLLELLLFGPLTAAAIADRIAARFGLPQDAMNAAVVRAYAHYFWDVNALDPGQWRNFVTMHYPSVATEYHAALSASRSRAGAAFVIAVADRDYQSLSPADRYEAASTMAFGMLMHHGLSCDGATGRVYAAAMALNMMRVADEQLALHRGASTDLIDELRRLGTVYDREKPLRITDATYINRPALLADSKVIDVPDDPGNP